MSPPATLEVRRSGHHEVCLLWAALVRMCQADAAWGQTPGDGRPLEQRRDDIKQKAGQIWLRLHFLLWITKRPSVFGTVGERGCRETEGETDRHREREADGDWEREREREQCLLSEAVLRNLGSRSLQSSHLSVCVVAKPWIVGCARPL